MSGSVAVTPLRHLGRLPLVALGINSVIGGGIFILPAEVTGLIGSSAIFAYVAAGLVVIGVGLALASLSSRYEISGGPYLYVHRVFGEFAGFQVGWLFCLARITAMAGLVNGFGRYLGALLPWAATPIGRALVIIACSALITAINMIGIRQTSRATNLFTVAKVVPLVVLAIAGLFFLRLENLAPVPVEPMSFVRAVLLLIFAFSGFEILTVCAIYLPVHLVAAGMLDNLASEQAPLASVAGILAGPAGRYAMTFIAATSMAGCALISLVGGTRLMYSMSSARQLPLWMGSLHAGWRTPVRATMIIGVLGTTLAIASAYSTLAAVSAGTRLLVYLACCCACLRRPAAAREDGAPGEPHGLRGRIIPALTSVAIVALLCALERDEIIGGLSGVGIGTVLYFGMRRAVPAVGGKTS